MRVFKARATKQGGHYHVAIFSASKENETFAKLGDLVMDEDDWEAFRYSIGKSYWTLEEPSPHDQ